MPDRSPDESPSVVLRQIWCPFDADVSEGDQLLSGAFTYTVKSKQEFTNGDNAHLELVCERESFDQ